VALCGAGALAGAVRFSVPDAVEGAPRRLAIGTLADFRMRTLTWLRALDLFVVRNEQGFGAFSSRCTHLGCGVQRTTEGFLCPCHGARYDPLGQVISGPARRPLPWYHLWREPDGRIWVDLDRPVDIGARPLLTAAEAREDA
jgi:Rieske Fe-S protein